jgi:tetratricopeptide (TPR) repeat protein
MLDPQRPESAYQLALAHLKSREPSSAEQARTLALKALQLQEGVQKRVQEKVQEQLDKQSKKVKEEAGEDLDEAMYKELSAMTEQQEKAASLATAAAATPDATPEMHAAAEEARVAYEEAMDKAFARYKLAREPVLVHNPVAGAHLVLAQLDQREGHLDEALEHVQSFIALRPTATDGYMLKVKLLQQQKQMLASYTTLATLLRVWQMRIDAANRAATVAATAKGAKKASKTPRADYFAAHPKEKQFLANIDAICAAPTSKQLQEKHAEFKIMCEQLNKLKKTN